MRNEKAAYGTIRFHLHADVTLLNGPRQPDNECYL